MSVLEIENPKFLFYIIRDGIDCKSYINSRFDRPDWADEGVNISISFEI